MQQANLGMRAAEQQSLKVNGYSALIRASANVVCSSVQRVSGQ
jgi:hypothetical protein